MDKAKIIKEEYPIYLEKEINDFIKDRKVISISCYFDNTTEEHVAVVHYQD
jgi:hypothetical protein